MKKQLLKTYAEVYELENNTGYLCKTRGGRWIVCDSAGRVVYGSAA